MCHSSQSSVIMNIIVWTNASAEVVVITESEILPLSDAPERSGYSRIGL